MDLIREKLLEVLPVTSAAAISGTGVVSLGAVVNIALLALIVIQILYVIWKWRRDWSRHRKVQYAKADRVIRECTAENTPTTPPEPRREV